MSNTSHLDALEMRHQQLDMQIAQEMRNLSMDDQKLRDLKRKKLELKDEMARIEKEQRH